MSSLERRRRIGYVIGYYIIGPLFTVALMVLLGFFVLRAIGFVK